MQPSYTESLSPAAPTQDGCIHGVESWDRFRGDSVSRLERPQPSCVASPGQDDPGSSRMQRVVLGRTLSDQQPKPQNPLQLLLNARLEQLDQHG